MSSAALPQLAAASRLLAQLSSPLWSGVVRRSLPVLDRASARVRWDFPLLEAGLMRLDPTLSLREVRAEVVSVADETADTKTYWLRPNARLGSFRAGSYITLQLSIDGRSVQRSYSLSSPPRADGLIAITVKRVPGGRVSNWLADGLRPGAVLTLGAPQGQFVLPAGVPAKLLLLSAGSGITPVMALLRELIARKSTCQITFLHFARTPRDIIFRSELGLIARTHPNVRLGLCVESTGGAADEAAGWTGARGQIDAQLLAQAAPEFCSLDTFLCGPPGFMRVVMQIFERAGADLSKLRYERFAAAFDPEQFLEHAQLLRFVRSGIERLSTRPRTILEEAESGGVAIRSGCRAGNCGTCRCRKLRGVVVDVHTGVGSTPGEEFIFPCVSVARGTVELDL